MARVASPLRPIIKWAGGKRWLVPQLAACWAPYAASHRLREPFAGGLAVALGVVPARAHLSDINPHLINLYQQIQAGLHITMPLQNNKPSYLAARARFNDLIAADQAHTAEAAQLFYYLNRTGFNGLCRFNKAGFYNVPWGKYRTIPYQTTFPEHMELFQRWTFTCGDFAAEPLDAHDWVFIDPPYDAGWTQYTKQGFGWADQVRLAEWAGAHRGPVVATNAATPRIVALYRSLGFEVHLVIAPRQIAASGNRAHATEMLAVRNLDRCSALPTSQGNVYGSTTAWDATPAAPARRP